MDNDIFLDRLGSARFVALLKAERTASLGKAQQNYLLCSAALQRRRAELAVCHERKADTSALESMISRLEAIEQAHRAAIRRLETER